MSAEPTNKEGWAMPAASRQFHYFDGMRSLCGSWLYGGPLDPGDGTFESPQDCKRCCKALAKRKADELKST